MKLPSSDSDPWSIEASLLMVMSSVFSQYLSPYLEMLRSEYFCMAFAEHKA